MKRKIKILHKICNNYTLAYADELWFNGRNFSNGIMIARFIACNLAVRFSVQAGSNI